MTQTIDNTQLKSEDLALNSSALNSQFSDLLDEQIASEELSELLKEDGVNESFYRYNLVSKILREEVNAPVSMGFINAVSKKIDAEPTIFAPSSDSSSTDRLSINKSNNNVIPLFSKIKKLTGGMAIAASVAVATFISVQSVQVANDGVFNSDIATQQSSPILQKKAIVTPEAIDPENYWLETAEQKELEFFNDMFMSKARQSEQEAIAPFARAVRGQSVGTIRFSKEQWENILRRSTRIMHENQSLKSKSEDAKIKENTPK
ncbi:MAG: hypothetical protein COB38_01620 [Gammaproteobacteria bacterium]|nr:MAG: hypothetical protein COB38_01620 [Gammaproteobacteria bacterium]